MTSLSQASPLSDEVTPESLRAEMLSNLKFRDQTIDTREGSYADALLSPSAYQRWLLRERLKGVLSMVFPDDTSGEYIDKNAAQIGMTRRAGKKASATVRFTGTDGTVLPARTDLYDPESGLKFLTAADCTIVNGTAAVAAVSEGTGAEYNLAAGRLVQMGTNLDGVLAVTNPAAAEGGADEESDADFFARYHERTAGTITSGNASQYEMWAKEMPGVSYAACVPLWAGNGTLKLIIAGANRSVLDDAVVSGCAAYIEQKRLIGASCTVVSVAEKPIALSAAVTLMPGATADDVKNQLTEAASGMMAGQPFGVAVTIPYSRFLACLLQCGGVADYTAFTVAGGNAAVAVQAGEIPVVGTVEVQ